VSGAETSADPPQLTPAGEVTPLARGVEGLEPVDPPTGVVNALPGEGTSLALTIDDGTSSEVVAAFAAFAADTGVRLTFFPNGCYRSWEDNADALRPLLDSGQVAMGNHTWSHPDLTVLSDQEVADEIGRNRDFLWRMFGVRDSPFFRPPFGARDDRIDRIAADQGHPTIAMWNGTLDDSRVLTGTELMAAAQEWFTAQTIVVGHANHATVTTLYGDLVELIRDRGLRTVTLADVWAAPTARLRGATARGTVRY
jgi:peptidoglycan/xylan/chitin deacetylase (PgdA/CDA1 family)